MNQDTIGTSVSRARSYHVLLEGIYRAVLKDSPRCREPVRACVPACLLGRGGEGRGREEQSRGEEKKSAPRRKEIGNRKRCSCSCSCSCSVGMIIPVPSRRLFRSLHACLPAFLPACLSRCSFLLLEGISGWLAGWRVRRGDGGGGGDEDVGVGRGPMG